MHVLHIKWTETDLASRAVATVFRHKLLNHINSYGIVELDFTEVLCISDCFADELFGVLVMKISFDDFIAQVKILHANESVYATIARNIKNRLTLGKREYDNY